eukprot:TRINITY_DN1336_c0_g1_i1.p1 TRINITY_DN1336_c0_g1~~TRINITY_DN1336_c0_g1_i1.p1  ORF type:complete len:583 (+),score=192.12 TRINITY_DN1336_c0_g1_i1:31-1779(+)
MEISIHKSYSGQSLFFTGLTGFVGKVFLFKVLKEFPDIKNIYCLIRTKKGQAPLDRFKQVIASECFSPLRKELGEEAFNARVAKVIPVAGDMMEDQLGLNDADYQALVDDVNYIVHMAATVDFQEKLNISVKMNVLGMLRVLSLARKCRNLQSFVHTSTCYVNWNRMSGEVPVKEQVYPLPFDPEEMCKYILALHDHHVPGETKALLAKYRFPNTYTFTKSIAEQLLLKVKGNIPVSIVRPAIIGCSWKEPMPGWIDVLTAAGAIILTAGLGILKDLHANANYVADLVPVDYVCSTLIKCSVKTAVAHRVRAASGGLADGTISITDVLAPYANAIPSFDTVRISGVVQVPNMMIEARQNGKGATSFSSSPTEITDAKSNASSATATRLSNFSLEKSCKDHPFVFQSCTSGSQNRLRWQTMVDSISRLWGGAIRHPKAVAEIGTKLVTTRAEYLFRLWVYRKIPFLMMKAAVSMPPPIGSPSKQKLLVRYEKALRRTEMLNFQFMPFTMNQWLYENNHSQQYLDPGLDERSAEAFATDVYDLSWWTYCELYSWGMTKFIMKSDVREQPQMPITGAKAFLKASL